MNPGFRLRSGLAAGCGALLASFAPASAQQENSNTSPATAAERPAGAPAAARVDYDSEPPYTFYERQWNRRFPAPYRRSFRREYYPFGRPYYPRRYSHWPVYDGDYPYQSYYGTDVFDDGYSTGFGDGRRFQQWQTKAELGLNSYLQAMKEGNSRFRAGDYASATRQFILAAKLNQGDAASRLHAVHAMTALGQYSAAVPALRRALQLQPKLIYLPLDIRSEYGPGADFEAHLEKLTEATRQVGDDAGFWLLLGYYQFFSSRPADALASLTRAAELDPHDPAARRFLEAARVSTPAEQTPEGKPPAPSPRRYSARTV